MNRYCTYETNCGVVEALTEEEFDKVEDLDDHAFPLSISDWVWQFAENKEQAKSQHAGKVDEWQADPSKETY